MKQILIVLFFLVFHLQAEELILVLEKGKENTIHSYHPYRFNECYTSDKHSSIEFLRDPTNATSTIITIKKYTGRKCERMNLKVSFDYSKYNQDVISGYIGTDILSLYVGERPSNTVGCVGIQGNTNCEGYQNIKSRCYTNTMSLSNSNNNSYKLERVENDVVMHLYYSGDFHNGEYMRTERVFNCNVCYDSVQYECV